MNHTSSNAKKTRKTRKNPVLICPGLGGTMIDFKLKESFYENEFVGLTDALFLPLEKNLWLNPFACVLQRNCFTKLLKPVYDKKTKKLKNIKGLATHLHGKFCGDVASCAGVCKVFGTEYLVPGSQYAHNLVSFLSKFGYEPNKNIFTLGYDFRFIPYPGHVDKYFSFLQKTIEKLYKKYNRKIHVIGHSMGCSLLNIFLNMKSLQWKNTYIKSFISVAPAYDGAPKSLRACLSGDNFNLNPKFFGNNSEYCQAERTMAGLVAMIPLHPQMYGVHKHHHLEHGNEHGPGNGNVVILRKDKRDKLYNLHSRPCMIDILKSISKRSKHDGLHDTAEMLKQMKHLRVKYGWTDPNVKVHQIMSVGIKTETGPYLYNLNDGGLDKDPEYNHTEGDGVVPLYGLYIPKIYKWKDVTFKTFKCSHAHLFINFFPVFQYILDILSDEL